MGGCGCRPLARRRLVAAPVVLLVGCLVARPAEGRILISYDLDSLVYLSDAVVEGTITGGRNNEVHVAVSAVYEGSPRVGGVVRAGRVVGLYRKPVPGRPFSGTSPLAKGDHVFLFLKEPGRPAGEVRAWSVVASGVKLASKGKVFGVSQYYGNPGPYVVESVDRYAARAVSVDPFRAQLRQSIARVAALAERLKAEPSPDEVPWLLAVLRERAGDWYEGHATEIGRLVAARLTIVADHAVLEKALALSDAWYYRATISNGFSSPSGREFLLAAIADEKRPLPQRIRLTRALRVAGHAYHVTFRHDAAGRRTATGQPRDGNAAYLTRIARLALASRDREPLCVALLQALDQFACYVRQVGEAHTGADLAAALPVLKRIHDPMASETLKFHVEVATRHADKDAYEKLGGRGGPAISIIRHVYHGEGRRQTPSGPILLDPTKVVFDYTVYAFLDEQTRLSAELVLEGIDGPGTHILPSPRGRWLAGRGQRGGMDRVALPRTVPSGRYRVYLQFKDGDRLVSRGHYAELALKR